MPTVIIADDEMIDVQVVRERLPPDATVEVRALPDTAAVVDAAHVATVLVVDVNTGVPAEAIEDSSLEGIARAGVGTDGVAFEAAADEGVTVLHVPEYGTEEVATHAVALLLACCRNVSNYDRTVERGAWDWAGGHPLRRLGGRTVGLVSVGPIARATAARLGGFGCELVGYDPYVDTAEMADHGIKKVSLKGLKRADHLSVHAPLTPETRGLVGADLLDALPQSAVVTNTGRGGVVDEEALLAALDAGEIRAAGLDVLADEPPEDNPLVGRDDVVVTPHAGWYSEEAKDALNRTLAADIGRVLEGRQPENDIDLTNHP